MNILLQSVKIIDPKSPFHQQTKDVLIENGIISNIGESIKSTSQHQVINIPGLHLSPGWIDSSVCFGEPGYEERETISNGLRTAAKSGFTQVMVEPNTYPIADSQSIISFIKQKAFGHATEVFPIGALTIKSQGEDLAELYDMKNAGAVAFGDYKKAISNANVLKIALQYVQDFDATVIAFSQESSIKGKGVANEGSEATKLGLKGIPTLAEEIQIARNLFLLEYTGGKMHIPTISTAKSVDLIREAKAKGLKVTCSVAAHHLVLTDSKLADFDTRYKVLPPLRNEETNKALLQGVLDGTIDCITSEHNPLDIEHKKLEFDAASFGTIGLESIFAALQTVLPTEVIIEKLTAGRAIFALPPVSIDIDQKANLTLFTTADQWTFNKEAILSSSKNAIFLNHPMLGKVHGVINGAYSTIV